MDWGTMLASILACDTRQDRTNARSNGMGMVQGLMGDVDEAKNAGTGGWLDAMSYMAGLSGGSWATTTFIANGGQHPSDLAKNVWNLKSNLIFPQDGKVSFYTDLLSEVKAKGKNFPTQITDYWGLALGNHLLPEQYHLSNNPNLTWSQFYSNSSQLQNGELPFPIIIAAERENGTTAVMENATIWEFNPFEFGSWAIGEATNKSWGFFTPIEYMGSNLTDGKPTECWKGYDQMTFVAGTSATLFNQGIIRLNNLDEGKNDSIILNGIRSILDSVSKDQNDISQIPNPGHGYNGDGNPLTELDYLTLIDAGETNQNIPLDPLLLRGADAIIAMDNSADTTYSWPNGSALWTTYQRSLEFVKYNNVPLIMPKVPTTNGFVNEGLNTRPTFFGCDEQDKTIIIYIPNYPWSYGSNSSTYKLEYSDEEVTPQLESAMRAMTLNGTVKDFPKCLACALTDRAFGYDKNNRTQECQQCFNTWCWNGQANDDPPPQNYTALPGVTPQWLVNNNLTTDPKGKDQAITTADKKKNAADTVGASKYVLVGAAITAITALF